MKWNILVSGWFSHHPHPDEIFLGKVPDCSLGFYRCYKVDVDFPQLPMKMDVWIREGGTTEEGF